VILQDIHYEQLRNTHHSVADTRRRLLEKLSELDKEVSKYYHELEKSDVREMSKALFLEGLQETLRKRRVVKEELRGINAIYDTTRKSVENLNESLQRTRNKSEKTRDQFNARLTIFEVF